MIRVRKEVFLEELKGSTMTAEALAKISIFVPRLEKVFLDDTFHHLKISDMFKSRSGGADITEAWKELAFRIMSCSPAKRRLRCLSLPGCAITDEIMTLLAPALVRVKKVHLARNPITAQGWKTLKNAFFDASAVQDAALTHFSLNAMSENPGGRLLHAPGMDQLSAVFPLLEAVDLSGQCELGADGWASLCNGLKLTAENAEDRGGIKLRRLTVAQCRLKGLSRTMLEDCAAKCVADNGMAVDGGDIEIDFGKSLDGRRKGKRAFLRCC